MRGPKRKRRPKPIEPRVHDRKRDRSGRDGGSDMHCIALGPARGQEVVDLAYIEDGISSAIAEQEKERDAP